MMAIAALVVGLLGNILSAMAIADPLRRLRWALGRFSAETTTRTCRSTTPRNQGLLQSGFNDMVRELSERQRMRDLFGRYVGEDVARRALERGTELGGQERDVAVLFVDLVGSTQLAATRPACGGRKSTSSSASSSTPCRSTAGSSTSSSATPRCASSARRSNIRTPPARHWPRPANCTTSLVSVLDRIDFGIEGLRSRAIAGHIGAQARFEYTVIGDPVNEAARLTELAKPRAATSGIGHRGQRSAGCRGAVLSVGEADLRAAPRPPSWPDR